MRTSPQPWLRATGGLALALGLGTALAAAAAAWGARTDAGAAGSGSFPSATQQQLAVPYNGQFTFTGFEADEGVVVATTPPTGEGSLTDVCAVLA